jgi:hypothetical protein
MDGRTDLTLRDGTISHLATEALGIDVAQALGVAVRGDRPLPLRCARLVFAVNDGVLTLQRGVLDNPDTTVRVGGTIDLRNEALGLVARARPKDVSPVSLRSPITITGTLSEPRIGVEGARLGARVAGAIALGAVFPPLALLPLFDPGEREQPDPCLRSEQAGATPPAAAASSRPPASR